MLKFKDPRITPPGGYIYQDPDTEQKFGACYLKDLVEKVRVHRASNELEVPPNLPAIIEDYICKRIPPSMTTEPAREQDFRERRLTLETVRRGTQIAMKAWKRTGKTVSKKEAKRRAQVCLKCIFNTDSTACASCHGLKTGVRDTMGVKTDDDKALKVCMVSAIMNVSHIHMTEKTLKAFTAPSIIDKHPESCWKRILFEEGVSDGTTN